MRLLGRPAPTDDKPARPRSHLRVLRADGQRIDLSSRVAGQMLVATRQGWQAEAWAYRDMIGEVRYAYRLLSRAVARVHFFPAVHVPGEDEPVPLDSGEHDLDRQLVADAQHNFARIPFDSNPDGFTARFTENLGVAGEGWVHIDGEDRFHVRSTSEVTVSGDGRVVLNTLPTAVQGSQRVLDPENEVLLRNWVPHPQWAQLADSAMRTMLDVAEDVVLTGREQRAAARSRVAANGFLLVPQGLSLTPARRTEPGEDDESTAEDRFMSDLTAAMLAPIRDDGDAQAVVPIVLRGEPEDLDKVRHLSVQRADAEALIARQGAAILRLLKGLDVQPEQVEGVGGMNHWGAWIIDAQSIRHQVEPAAHTLAACLAQSFLRPTLASLEHPPDVVARLTIGIDPSALTENPNRGQDARDAHAALVISDAKLREDLGYTDDDAPDDDELVRRLAMSGRLPPDLTAAVLGVQRPQQPVVVNGQTTARPALPGGDVPAAGPGQLHPAQTTPAEPDLARGPAGPVVAAAAPPAAAPPDTVAGWVVDVETARRLADIDAALTERITVAADAALARVLERAGARVRTAARRDQAVTAALKGVDAHLIPARLGRERVEAFVPVADLISEAYMRLRGQVRSWLGDAARQVAGVVLELLRLDRRSDRGRAVADAVESRLGGHAELAWNQLAGALDHAAERALFAPDPFTPDPDLPGEGTRGLIRPGEVRRAVAVAGGSDPDDPAGGIGTGATVRELLGEQGAVHLGWEWQYRPEIPRARPFPPHQALNGRRFGTFTDPKLDTDASTAWLGAYFRPQDHDGCSCRAVPILAVLDDDPDDIVGRRLREAAGDPRNLLAARVAAEDTAAGRVGTSLQNEVEVRERITRDVALLRRQHIEHAEERA